MATGAVKESEEERKRVRDVLVRQFALQAPRQAYPSTPNTRPTICLRHGPAIRRPAIRHRPGNDASFGSGALALLELPQASQLALGGGGSSLGGSTTSFGSDSACFGGAGSSLGTDFDTLPL